MKLINLPLAMVITTAVLFCGCGTTDPEEGGITADMRFTHISSGSFEMGAPADEEWSTALERPVHTVSIDYSFDIMAIEVTQGMWEEVMGSNPATGEFIGANYPVFNVSWSDCQEFCSRLNQLHPEHTYRLPTESEWEYCCRAGTTKPFFWGDIWMNGQNYAWFIGGAGGVLHSGGELQKNDWDLFDTCGNLYEWCEDSYHDSKNHS